LDGKVIETRYSELSMLSKHEEQKQLSFSLKDCVIMTQSLLSTPTTLLEFSEVGQGGCRQSARKATGETGES